MSDKYDNFANHFSFVNNSQNSGTSSRVKNTISSSFNSCTLDKTLPRDSYRTSVCKISLVNCDSIASHNKEKSRDFNGLILIKFTIFTTSSRTFFN